MYQVNIGAKILYYPGNHDYDIYSTSQNEEVGKAGEFEYKVPPTNPLYSQHTTGQLITILKDKKEFWRGEIRDIKTDFNNVADIYCAEDLAWLGDEYLTPASITTETYAQRFQAAIDAYNLNRPAERQFRVGYITNVQPSDFCEWITEYNQSILDCLRKCIAKDTGYIRVRRVTSGGTVTRYIDIVKLSDYGKATSQNIEYGYNLLDYVKESDYSKLTNVLTPYGVETDNEIYESYNQRIQGTTITDQASVNVYGRHAKAVIFNDAEDVASLNAVAADYLSRYSQPELTMEIKAIDLSQIENVDSLDIGDSIRVIAKPYAIDQRLYLTQIKRDIQNPDKNTITISGHVQTGKTLTSQMIGTATAVKNLPSKSSILDAAKKNALAMLLDETQGGYVVYEYHKDASGKEDYIEAINICNATTIDQSTKRWRWSQNGFGYMHRNNTTDAWTGPTVAMTMDGSIVADFITSGTMSCDRLNGGTINGQTINGGNINGTNITGANISGSEITVGAGHFLAVGSGYIKLHENGPGDSDQWVYDVGCKYCNCQYYEGGTWHWVNGGAHEVYHYLEGAWSPSDQRAKTNIRRLDPEFSKEFIKRMDPKEFEFNYKRGIKQFGMIAQDVDETLRDMGYTDKNGLVEVPDDPEEWMSIEYKQYVPHLINCIKDLYAEIEKLKGEQNG